ncbi:FAD/NAD(P)-binding protein [Streptomyces venezuelae]|uniref:FAD/NAD(P)-binding protein n=1 Tax=Streptomyces venezuelae TaxID=54571 RepID=UPI00332CC534
MTASTAPAHRQIVIVGMGSRGLSTLERLCAHLATHAHGAPTTIHVADPFRPGRSPQPPTGTAPSQVSVVADDSHEHYLRSAYAYRRVRAGEPARVTMREHRTGGAVFLDDEGLDTDRRVLGPQNGRVPTDLEAAVPTVVRCGRTTPPGGHEAELTAFATRHALTYVPPASPADLDRGVGVDSDLDRIPAGQTVLLRGLGPNFFDHMERLTEGRGGTYTRYDGRLTYHPSGAEPHLVAGSRRGVPHQVRGADGRSTEGRGRYRPRLPTTAWTEHLRALAERGEPLDFVTDLWPLIAVEVETAYYATLLRSDGRAADADPFGRAYRATRPEHRDALLDRWRIAPEQRWTCADVDRPHHGIVLSSPDHFHRWLLDHLREDLAEAHRGNVNGPVGAAFEVLHDLRDEIRIAIGDCSPSGGTHRDHIDDCSSLLDAFLSVGPPASRIEEMIALIEAGVLQLLGPGTLITCDDRSGAFLATSAVVGTRIRARALIDARQPVPRPPLGLRPTP